MIRIASVPVPDVPGDRGGPVFREPWHAEVFSLAVALNRQGVFTWSEWVEVFSTTVEDIHRETSANVESVYYQGWLNALERLVARKNLVSVEEMTRRKEEWRRAYLRTPHGQPVELKEGPSLAKPHGYDRSARPEPIAVSPSRTAGAAKFSFGGSPA
jgi:nitrile hydratase accessory protein